MAVMATGATKMVAVVTTAPCCLPQLLRTNTNCR
jgi:hypothetical protein